MGDLNIATFGNSVYYWCEEGAAWINTEDENDLITAQEIMLYQSPLHW